MTKRVRRVFTFSYKQLVDTFSICRPDVVFLTFRNYLRSPDDLFKIEGMIKKAAKTANCDPEIVYQWGPTTDDVGESYEF